MRVRTEATDASIELSRKIKKYHRTENIALKGQKKEMYKRHLESLQLFVRCGFQTFVADFAERDAF